MKKTRSMLALLVCLALLVSLCAVTASAAEAAPAEVVANNVDFTLLESTAAGGDATKTIMEGMGLTIPEGSNWEITDHFFKLAMPKDGYAPAYYIQTLEAGEGKVLAADATLELAHALAALNEKGEAYDVGSVTVWVSTDGENYTEVWANKSGQGTENKPDASVFGVLKINLTGTAGAAKVWIKIGVDRHAGPGGGAIGWSKASGVAMEANRVTNRVNFRALTPTDAGDASHAAMEALGLIIPEDSKPWQIQNCIQNLAVPQDGYAPASFIQTLDLGDKTLTEDAVLNLGYYMAELGDPSWMVIDWSTDGETWTDEGWVDETGKGGDWEAAEQHDIALTLDGTAGHSKVYVRVTIERHSGPIGGSILYSTISGNAKAGTTVTPDPEEPSVTPDPENPKDGDMISIFVALAMVCAAGAVITTKKFRKEN